MNRETYNLPGNKIDARLVMYKAINYPNFFFIIKMLKYNNRRTERLNKV